MQPAFTWLAYALHLAISWLSSHLPSAAPSVQPSLQQVNVRGAACLARRKQVLRIKFSWNSASLARLVRFLSVDLGFGLVGCRKNIAYECF